MLGAVAQYDTTQIVARLRGVRLRKKAQTGREGEQQVLERMRQLRAAGMPYYVIVDQLNQEGVSIRSGTPWRILERRHA